MSDSRASAGLDRLPWLADEPKLQKQPVKRDLAGWATAAVVLVVGASFWLGSKSTTMQPKSATSVATKAPAQLPSPQAEVRMAPQPQVSPSPVPEVRSGAVPEVRIAPPPRRFARHDQPRHSAPAPRPASTADAQASPVTLRAPVAPVAPSSSRPAVLRPWPSRVTEGAYGRLVQIGAYGSRLQAKRGWVAMVRAYPAVAHLQAVVVESRNSHRRAFYRFQIGTTSQAHSEVLCQRMEGIHLSCAVIGLPWKSKVER